MKKKYAFVEDFLTEKLRKTVSDLFYSALGSETLPYSLYSFICKRVEELIPEVRFFGYSKAFGGVQVITISGVKEGDYPRIAQKIEETFWKVMKESDKDYLKWEIATIKELIIEELKNEDISIDAPFHKGFFVVSKISKLVSDLKSAEEMLETIVGKKQE